MSSAVIRGSVYQPFYHPSADLPICHPIDRIFRLLNRSRNDLRCPSNKPPSPPSLTRPVAHLSIAVRPPIELRSNAVRAPFELRSSTVRPPFELRSSSVRAPFGHRSSSVRAPFEHRSATVRAPFERRSSHRSSAVRTPFARPPAPSRDHPEHPVTTARPPWDRATPPLRQHCRATLQGDIAGRHCRATLQGDATLQGNSGGQQGRSAALRPPTAGSRHNVPVWKCPTRHRDAVDAH